MCLVHAGAANAEAEQSRAAQRVAFEDWDWQHGTFFSCKDRSTI